MKARQQLMKRATGRSSPICRNNWRPSSRKIETRPRATFRPAMDPRAARTIELENLRVTNPQNGELQLLEPDPMANRRSFWTEVLKGRVFLKIVS